jgi:hypothetical protein
MVFGDLGINGTKFHETAFDATQQPSADVIFKITRCSQVYRSVLFREIQIT